MASTMERSAGALAFLAALTSLVVRSWYDPGAGILPSLRLPTAALPPAPVQRLQAYLRIRTDHPSPDYDAALRFLTDTLAERLPVARVWSVELVPGKPILLARIPGEDPDLPAILLNSHTDVVPAETEHWDWDPFAARLVFVDKQWRVYARGAQDMKSVSMQYIEALSELWHGGWKPIRDVVLSFVPDEEIGGMDGLGKLVDSGRMWRNLSIGAGLDEGLPNPSDGFNVYYGERQPWWLSVQAVGDPGHGALSPPDTAGMQIQRVIARAMTFREEQRKGFDPSVFNSVGDTVGVNLVYMETGIKSNHSTSGYLMNIIPSTARCGFDIRVPPAFSAEMMDEVIKSWMACTDGNICPGITYEFHHKVQIPSVTEERGPFAQAFLAGLEQAHEKRQGPAAHPGIFFAGTDARFVRALGIPSIGFSPMENLPNLLHKHNEYITVKGYLDGIKVYKSIIRQIGSVWPEPGEEDTCIGQAAQNHSGVGQDSQKQAAEEPASQKEVADLEVGEGVAGTEAQADAVDEHDDL